MDGREIAVLLQMGADGVMAVSPTVMQPASGEIRRRSVDDVVVLGEAAFGEPAVDEHHVVRRDCRTLDLVSSARLVA